jgi:hypothetical protein
MINGFILLHKKILENPVFAKAELLQLFIYCIIKANYEDKEFIFNGKIENVKRGSFITGQIQLSKELKQSQSSVYRRLNLLKKLGYIELKVNNRFTLVTVVKYNTYQDVNYKMNNKRITTEYNKQYNNNKEKRTIIPKTNFPMDTKNKEKNYLYSVVKLFMVITNKEKSNCFALVQRLLKYKAEDNLTYLQKCLMLMYIIKANQDTIKKEKYIGILTNQYRELSYSDFKYKVFSNSVNTYPIFKNNYEVLN